MRPSQAKRDEERPKSSKFGQGRTKWLGDRAILPLRCPVWHTGQMRTKRGKEPGLSVSGDMIARETVFRFGVFRLDRQRGVFRLHPASGWEPVVLGSRALDLLIALAERPGELVSKQELMAAVWPGMAVEEANLTVQISALRRLLDEGRAEGSNIQTVIGRGYRFLPAVATHPEDEICPAAPAPATDPVAESADERPEHLPGRVWRPMAAALGGIVIVALLLAVGWQGGWLSSTPSPPPLSIVVLPFENLSGDPKDDYLAEAITDDLTTDLSHIPAAFVIARESAYTYKGKPEDVRNIGHELGVRYLIEGSVRRIDATLRINVQLTSAQTGKHLWSDRFDEQIIELAAGQEQAVARMSDSLGISLVDIESARGMRERPTNPAAFDLLLRASSIKHLPSSPQRNEAALALYEHALLLDPTSVAAMVGVAYFLLEMRPGGKWGNYESMQRAGRLLMHARTIAPESALNAEVYWLRSVGRCQEVIEAAQHAIQTDPNRMRTQLGVYNELAVCKTQSGRAEAEIALQETLNQLNPRSPWMFNRYRRIGFASLMLGRNQDAIAALQRSLALNPEADLNQWVYRWLAAAYAETGQMAQARHFLSEADRLSPYDTVRSHAPEDLSSTVYVEQCRRYQAALRLAGERDHADEDADFGVPTDGALHGNPIGLTPTDAPGAKTIRTADLARFLAEARPAVIDTVSNSWGRSIPGAVGLKFAGLGGRFTDAAQDNLRNKMRELTDGDLNRPVIAVGWNSEFFDGRNLALRLVALGYTQVYWYRGGREAWEVANLSETDLALQEW